MRQFLTRFASLAFAIVVLCTYSQGTRAESTIVLKNPSREEGQTVTFFVKASSKEWSKAVRMEMAPGASRSLRLASKDTFNVAIRNSEGVILVVSSVKKWDPNRGFGGEFVPVAKEDIDLHKILSEGARGKSRYHVMFKGIGTGKSPSDFTPKENAAPGGEMGRLEVTPRGGTLEFPALFG